MTAIRYAPEVLARDGMIARLVKETSSSGKPKSCRIGTMVYHLPHVMENRYETASWYQRVEVPAGAEGEVTATWGNMGDMITAKWVGFPTLTGTLIDSYFPSSFAGHVLTAGDQHKADHGKPATVGGGSTYGYSVAAELVGDTYGKEPRLLEPGDGRTIRYYGAEVNGEPGAHYATFTLDDAFTVRESGRYEATVYAFEADQHRKPVEKAMWQITPLDPVGHLALVVVGGW